MTVRSYADTTIGAVFFHLPLDQEPDSPAVQALVEAGRERRASARAREAYALGLVNYLESSHPDLLVHEWFHIIQAVAYPTLYLRCARELALMERIIGTYRRRSEGAIAFRGSVGQRWWETLYHPVLPYAFTRGPQGLEAKMADHRDRGRDHLSEQDLLEEDASVFQYKVEVGGEGTGDGYKKWLARRHRYTMTFRFLERHFGTEGAFVALPALVQAAFSTTWPLPVFARLTEWFANDLPDLPEIMGREGFAKLVPGRLGTFPPASPAIDGPMADDAQGVFDLAGHERLVKASPKHPLAPLAADFIASRGSDPSWPSWLQRPYEAFSLSPFQWNPELDRFWPPVMSLRPSHPALGPQDGLRIFAPRFHQRPLPFAPDVGYDAYLNRLHVWKLIAFSLTTDIYDGLPHECPHVDCPVRPAELCRRWPFIPREPAGCSFPQDFESTVRHRIDVEAGRLVPVSTRS